MQEWALSPWAPGRQEHKDPFIPLRCRKRIPDDAKLDLSGAAQGMAPAAIGLIFQPDFMVQYLLLDTRPDIVFFQALRFSAKSPLAKFKLPPGPAMSLQKTAPCPMTAGRQYDA